MPFDWGKYLELARLLQKHAGSFYDEECCLRNAVSRSYYAAFCYARDEAKKNKNFPIEEKGKEHIAVRKWYEDQAKPHISSLLKDLQRWRKQCDYDHDMDMANLNKMSQEAIKNADEIITGCNKRVI